MNNDWELAKETGGSPESRRVWQYFNCSPNGFFVDVGANHPTKGNQTWYLEQQGWTGLLIEPHPEYAAMLRAQRPRSRTFQVCVGSPRQVGTVDFYLGGRRSSPNPDVDVAEEGQRLKIPLTTLDAVLKEASVTRIDFLSLDVEEMELDALDGLDLHQWSPQLILIEDFFYHQRKHAYLRQRNVATSW
jgi:FkbM family methyltransferase